jgi:putative phosphoribosyl transferase
MDGNQKLRKPIFQNREQAGIFLLERIKEINCIDCLIDSSQLVVASIPNGGVATAKPIIKALNVPSCIILSKKIPLMGIPYVGLGAVSENFELFNHDRIQDLQLPVNQVDEFKHSSWENIKSKKRLFHDYLPSPIKLQGKDVLIIDDGIASGYTMMSAIKEVERFNPNKIIVATPIISSKSIEVFKNIGVGVLYYICSDEDRFVVDEFYENFVGLSNEEVLHLLSPIIEGETND